MFNSKFLLIFSILVNIIVPILGVLLYLIIRPSQTNIERYYEEIEHKMLIEGSEEKISCEKCLSLVDKNYVFCPNCGSKVNKYCSGCKKSFPGIWNICPYCGKVHKAKTKSKSKSITKRSIKKPAIKK